MVGVRVGVGGPGRGWVRCGGRGVMRGCEPEGDTRRVDKGRSSMSGKGLFRGNRGRVWCCHRRGRALEKGQGGAQRDGVRKRTVSGHAGYGRVAQAGLDTRLKTVRQG